MTVRLKDAANVVVATGSATIPTRAAGFDTGVIIVGVLVPAGIGGKLTAEATADVNFSGDSANGPVTATAIGDTVICIVEPSLIDPLKPRLDMEIIGQESIGCGPGVQHIIEALLTNNDQVNSVDLTCVADSKQRGRLPTSPNGQNDGTSSFSNPFVGDDSPICFQADLPPNGILPLDQDPGSYTQRPINKLFTIAAGGTATIRIVGNSYLQCVNGSCSEFTIVASGWFANGDDVTACVGASLNIVPAQPCEGAQFTGACCLAAGACQNLSPEACLTAGGTFLGAYTECMGDLNPVDGVDDACVQPLNPANGVNPQACCFAPSGCALELPADCVNMGGTPQGVGTNCGNTNCPIWEACCFPDGTCQLVFSAAACASMGGTPQGAGSACTPVQGCCFPDGTCNDLDPLCCADKGGVPCGPGNLCLGDNNNNGVDDACELPMSDHIPAVSNVGLVALLLLTAVAGVIVIRRTRRGHAAG